MILNSFKIGHGGFFFTVLIVICICFTMLTAFSKNENHDNYGSSVFELVNSTAIIKWQEDSVLTKSVKTLLNRYHPPNGFILLMDAETGNIIAWGQRENNLNSEEPTFLQRDSFPAASLAKIVTAVAAIENGINSKSEFPKIGRNSTLYKRQIFPNENYKGATITLEDAFAKSNNPAMGIIGMKLGKNELQFTAEKLGFSNFSYPDSDYELAESSCGFTKRNIISPIQAANAIRKLIFEQPPEDFYKNTYDEMHALFLRTVTDGTAKTYMRKNIYNYNKKLLNIGGKTGSLDGDSPAGRYDWFAGFAQSKTELDKGVIIIVMQVHDAFRNQHSSSIAGLLINEWAKHKKIN